MSAQHTPVMGAARPAVEARCTAQGAAAPKGAVNPYREGSAAATWWQRGHAAARATAEGSAS